MMKVEPLCDAVGARVTGLNLAQPLDAETHAALHKAWMDYQVLVIPDQDFTQEEQINFARTWGPFPKRERYEKRAEKTLLINQLCWSATSARTASSLDHCPTVK
jgi:alpha-ketoglutarate-dependent taurine dioxygenase